MKNYEAIMKMSVLQLEAFLDEVYCTGLSTGQYASRCSPNEACEVLGENPFSIEWLAADAETAVLPDNPPGEERDCLEAYARAVLRNAGIPYEDTE